MNLLEVNLEKLFAVLGTDPEDGLTEEQAQRNRREFGENILFEKKDSTFERLKKIFGDAMMVVLLFTCLFDFLGSGSFASLVSLVLVVVCYFAYALGTRYYVARAQKKVEKYCKSKYRVRREGHIRSVRKSELVAGDILILEKGDVMPCDGIILQQKSLRILEASVTGRRVPLFKRSHAEVEKEEGYPYFECILFAGSVLLQGQAIVFVCNVGKDIFDNENFAISRQNTTVPQIYETALYLKKQISLIWVLACFVLFAWGIFRGQGIFRIFYFTVALAIAAFPDAIELLCDLSVAYMTSKIFDEGCVLRNPGAIDRLCDANCIFVNSSDYLFYAQPVAGQYYVGDRGYDFKDTPEKARPLLENLLLTQPPPAVLKSLPHKEQRAEKVLLSAAASVGLQQRTLRRDFLHINTYDYDPRYGFAASLVLKGDVYRLAVRGDLQAVLNACTTIERDGVVEPLTEGDRIRLRSLYRSMAASCERIFSVASRELSSPAAGDQRQNAREMTFLGFFGLSTPISAAAAKAVSTCQKSGIETYLLTDDYPETVASISQSVSIIREEDYPYALGFRTYQRMDRGVFIADIGKYKAFCNFPAEEKQSVIRYHKEDGDIVISLAGGLYDTLPQMESDISFVSTKERYHATKLNADILVREKRFDLVPLCINWARTFYRNIVHIMQYTLVLQVALFLTVFIGLASSGTTVFSVLPLLAVSLTICLPSAMNLFHRRPGMKLESNEGVLSKDRIYSLQALLIIPVVVGVATAIAVMLSYRVALFLSGSVDAAAGAALVTFGFSSFFTSLTIKFDDFFYRNVRLLGKTELISFCATVVSLGILIFSPFARLYQSGEAAFGSGLSFAGLLFAFLFSLVPFGIMELMKLVKKDDSAQERDS